MVRYNINQLLMNWLKADPADRLRILSGGRTENKPAGHFGLLTSPICAFASWPVSTGSRQAGRSLFYEYHHRGSRGSS
jgi:hypothetical protein